MALGSERVLFDPAAPAIDRFIGPYRVYSNFWPCSIILSGDLYPSVEYAYQAAKSLDPVYRRMIRSALSPGKAKRLGRSVNLRADWSEVRLPTMRGLVRQKFALRPAGNLALRVQLAATYPARLVEGNSWGDTFWGVCDGVGENHLGRLLMEIRNENRQVDSEWIGRFDWTKI